MAATAMEHDGGAEVVVTPGELLGPSSSLEAGRGAYADGRSVRASRSTVEVVGHKAHGAVPQPGSIVIARVTKVMARMASADIMCVDSKAVKEKFTGMIRQCIAGKFLMPCSYVCRQQDVRATEIDKLSLGDARAYYLSTAKNELGVVSAQSIAGGTLVPTSWTEMQCELTGQIEQRKVAKVE
ncbi:unnamed protein product [Triticum turgidum subsp. durum]|uniref:Exosome complex component N-terminal domain-containing protein n=1 Tax=Triticum turgidum subsp. durum TaxID=4567 RepID=A0A9R1APW0_TRITD|nr:unnamed protein product [Triticum turgidum subsp. durum]